MRALWETKKLEAEGLWEKKSKSKASADKLIAVTQAYQSLAAKMKRRLTRIAHLISNGRMTRDETASAISEVARMRAEIAPPA